MTLVEVLVAVFLLAIVGTIVSGVVISAMKVTRQTQSGVEGQSQLNDAVSRITRDIAAADPILYTSTANGWSTATPSRDELWVQNVSGNKCVRTRYYVTTVGTAKQLKADIRTYGTSTCPDPRLPDTGGTMVTKTLVSDLKTTNDAGVDTKVFTYYTRANTEITAPVSRANVENIARVKIDVGSNVRERAKGVRLTTSVAPRSMDNPLVTNLPLPSCGDANLRVVNNGLKPSSPVVSWDATPNASKFTLNRTTVTPQNSILTTTQNPLSPPFTDTGMKGYWGVTITYDLTIEGPGGIVDCYYDYTPPPAMAPSAVALSGTVTPDTSAAPATVAASTVTLTWPAATEANAYDIYRRPIDPDTAPYNPTGTGTWTFVTTTTSLTYSQNPGFDQAFEYKVVGKNTDYTPAVTGPDSNGVKALTHTNPTSANGSATGYGKNTITWTATASPTADGYAVWRRPDASSPWTLIKPITNLATTSYDDEGVALGSTFDYMVTTFNEGPRGGIHDGTTYTPTTARYYSTPSNIVSVLQYPDIPITVATGTYWKSSTTGKYIYANPDGTNNIWWSTPKSATSYKVFIMDNPAATSAMVYDARSTLSWNHIQRPAGSRTYYSAVACNATGCSQNEGNTAVRAANLAVAYQRPSTPVLTNPTNPTLAANDIGFTMSYGADSGQPSGKKFCTEALNTCTYEIVRDGSTETSLDAVSLVDGTGTPLTSGAYTQDFSEATSAGAWGRDDNYQVSACNPGGCSEPATLTFNHYPGPFWFPTDSNNNPKTDALSTLQEMDHMQWWEPSNNVDHTRTSSGDGKTGTVASTWTDSTGVKATNGYRYQLDPKASDPTGTTVDVSRSVSNTTPDTVTPGAAYNITVTATAPNGLQRTMKTSVQIPPPPPGFMESAHACKETITDGTAGAYKGWKTVYRYRTNAVANRNSSQVNTYQDRFKYVEIVSKVADGEADYALGAQKADKAEVLGGDNQGTATQWANLSGGDFYYRQGYDAANQGMLGPKVAVKGALSDDGFYVKSAAGGMSFAEVRTVVNKDTTGHVTDYGDWSGTSIGVLEYSKSGGADCPGFSGWNYDETTISRWAVRGMPSGNGNINPNTSAGAKYNYFSGALS